MVKKSCQMSHYSNKQTKESILCIHSFSSTDTIHKLCYKLVANQWKWKWILKINQIKI